MSRRLPTVWDIRRSGAARFEALTSKPNVRYMTVGHKVKNGVRLPDKSLNFYVARKEQVAPEDAIPKQIDWLATDGRTADTIATDVTELGSEPATFGLRSGHILRAFDNDVGVCAVAYTNGGRKFLLTNAHVVVNAAAGGAAGPVDVLNRTDGQFYRFGVVANASQLRPGIVTTHDVARIEVNPAFTVDDFMILDLDNDIDRLEGIETLSAHRYWYRVNGQQFECAFPERVVGSVIISVDGIHVPYAEFWQLQMVAGAVGKGHSGALLCRSDGTEVVACGLVFGGVAPNLVFAFPFNKMWKIINP